MRESCPCFVVVADIVVAAAVMKPRAAGARAAQRNKHIAR